MQRNVLEYLEATAPRLPDKIAYSNGKDSLTFAETQRAAKGIGSFLLEKGHRAEPVVVFMANTLIRLRRFSASSMWAAITSRSTRKCRPIAWS